MGAGTGGSEQPKQEPPPPSGLDMAGLGIQFAAAILLFLYAGKWLDAHLGTAPLFLILGVFLGAGGSFYSMYRKLVKPYRK